MSDFFRGPSLASHVFALAPIAGISIQALKSWLGSMSQALVIGIGGALVYVAVALLWEARGVLGENQSGMKGRSETIVGEEVFLSF